MAVDSVARGLAGNALGKIEGIEVGGAPYIQGNNWWIWNNGGYIDSGVKAIGIDGNGIDRIELTSTTGRVDLYTIYFSDGATQTYTVTNGADGADGTDGTNGVGISKIEKTSTVGLVDTYTITYTNGTTFTYQVTNGKDGSGGGGGTDDHTQLINRDAVNQHPMAAVTGLVTEISAIETSLLSTGTQISGLSTRIGENETEIDNLGGSIQSLDADVEQNTTNISSSFKSVSYNSTTGILTFTKHDNTTQTVDLPLELLIESGQYNPTTKNIELVLANGDKILIPAGDLVKEYTADGTTITLDGTTFSLSNAVVNKIDVLEMEVGAKTSVTVDGNIVTTWNADTKQDVNQAAQATENLYVDDTGVLKNVPPTGTTSYRLTNTATVFTYSAPTDGAVLRNTSYQFNATAVLDNNGADWYDIGVIWKINDQTIATFSDRFVLGRQELRDYISAPVINRLINNDIPYSAGDTFSLEITGAVSAGNISLETSAESPIFFVRNGALTLSTNEVFGVDKDGNRASQADINAELRQGGVSIVQTTGQSTTAVMSQKAVTDELDGKQDIATETTYTAEEVAAGVALADNEDVTITGSTTTINVTECAGAGTLTLVAGATLTVTVPSGQGFAGLTPTSGTTYELEITEGLIYNMVYFKGTYYIDGGR